MTGVACVGCGFCQGDGWVAGVEAAAAWVRLSSAGLEIAVKAEESLSPGALVSAAFTCLEGKSDSETERAAKAIKAAIKKRPSAARGSRFTFMGLCGEWVRRRWALLASIALAVPGPRERKKNVPATSLASRAGRCQDGLGATGTKGLPCCPSTCRIQSLHYARYWYRFSRVRYGWSRGFS